ncbi:MAG: TonB-dependent receptor plug domain-containing protein, partial [Woeseiaceae bacterium]|nr:TonB-dependent receptor plug domain-containing protein [Woeseiaceae bacterium]
MTIKTPPRARAALTGVVATLLAFSTLADDSTEQIDEIVVTADLLGRSVDELPASLTLLDADEIDALSVQHFEELVNVVPNLNWSGDGHRARYFQIRGVGELEQYQGAPNPSVGFLVDDIDFSGIGTVATLFDIERIEVLRGPQGSRYGANALAGLVYMQSAAPTAERNGRVHLSAGEDDLWSAGIAFGGALSDDERALFRLSAEQHRSDGFRRNAFLGSDDTNGRDELTVRGRLLLEPTDSVAINIAAMFADIDNGYDAFALDNSYTVLSDKPGSDAQRSSGVSARIDWFVDDRKTLTSITAYADSDIGFGFDADWGNDDSWAPFTYDYTSASDRSRRTLSQELRLASAGADRFDWLAGIYALRLDDGLRTRNVGEYFDPFSSFADSLDDDFASDYRADTIAAFGQVERTLGADTRLAAGLRLERRSADYRDSAGLTASPAETM